MVTLPGGTFLFLLRLWLKEAKDAAALAVWGTPIKPLHRWADKRIREWTR